MDKQLQNAVLTDVQQDFQRGLQKVNGILQEYWGDDHYIPYEKVEDLLYLVKVVEQRLRYLSGQR